MEFDEIPRNTVKGETNNEKNSDFCGIKKTTSVDTPIRSGSGDSDLSGYFFAKFDESAHLFPQVRKPYLPLRLHRYTVYLFWRRLKPDPQWIHILILTISGSALRHYAGTGFRST
jgi:hypothetical protein